MSDSSDTQVPASEGHVLVSAAHEDVPELVAIARCELPGMTYLHHLDGWKTHRRFGVGTTPRDNLFIVARRDDKSPILGFCWVDAVMYIDNGIKEPWWCINALAAVPSARRTALGHSMAEVVKRQAAIAGAVSLYGVCYPSSVEFWAAQGFAVSAPGGYLEADRLIVLPSRGQVTLKFNDRDGGHLFVVSLDVGDPDAVPSGAQAIKAVASGNARSRP
jgi:hypothetical protein